MNDLAYGASILIIGVPLLLFYLIIIPEGIMLDVNEGLELILSLKFIEGLFLITRPVWSFITIATLFWALGNPDKIVEKVKNILFRD